MLSDLSTECIWFKARQILDEHLQFSFQVYIPTYLLTCSVGATVPHLHLLKRFSVLLGKNVLHANRVAKCWLKKHVWAKGSQASLYVSLLGSPRPSKVWTGS